MKMYSVSELCNMTNWQVSCILAKHADCSYIPTLGRLAMYTTLSKLGFVDNELVILFKSNEFEKIFYSSDVDIINMLSKCQVKHIIHMNRQHRIMIAFAIILRDPQILEYVLKNITPSLSML